MVTAAFSLIGILFSAAAFAKAPTTAAPLKRKPAQSSCSPLAWSKKRDFPRLEAVNLLESIPRNDLVRMAWMELTVDSEKPLYPLILAYLSSTEMDRMKRGYFKGILYMTNADLDVENVLAQWPIAAHPERKWTVNELCRLWQKSGGQ